MIQKLSIVEDLNCIWTGHSICGEGPLWIPEETDSTEQFQKPMELLIKNSEGTPHQSVAPDSDLFSAVSKVSVETDVE